MKNQLNNENGTPIVAQGQEESKRTFADLMRMFEIDYASGDYADSLQELAYAVTASVLAKLADPRRKVDGKNPTGNVSNSGQNPAMLQLRRELQADKHSLVNIRTAVDSAYAVTYTKDGEPRTEVVNREWADVADELSAERLGDAVDLAHDAIIELLAQAQAHAITGPGWLEVPYTVRRLSRKVYIRLEDSAEYREEETTPIQEVYRAVRRAVQNSRAVQTDPRNGYSYIEDLVTNEDGTSPADAVYFRLGKYADLGGASVYGLYTTDRQSVMDYDSIMTALNLTTRQATVLNLSMRGYGYKAIATYLGIDPDNVQRTFKQIRKRCEKVGFTPSMWAEMNK